MDLKILTIYLICTAICLITTIITERRFNTVVLLSFVPVFNAAMIMLAFFIVLWHITE